MILITVNCPGIFLCKYSRIA